MVKWNDAEDEDGLLVGHDFPLVYFYNRGKNKLVTVDKGQIVAVSADKVIFPAYKVDKKNIELIQG
jgi:hypothetical protein